VPRPRLRDRSGQSARNARRRDDEKIRWLISITFRVIRGMEERQTVTLDDFSIKKSSLSKK